MTNAPVQRYPASITFAAIFLGNVAAAFCAAFLILLVMLYFDSMQDGGAGLLAGLFMLFLLLGLVMSGLLLLVPRHRMPVPQATALGVGIAYTLLLVAPALVRLLQLPDFTSALTPPFLLVLFVLFALLPGFFARHVARRFLRKHVPLPPDEPPTVFDE